MTPTTVRTLLAAQHPLFRGSQSCHAKVDPPALVVRHYVSEIVLVLHSVYCLQQRGQHLTFSKSRRGNIKENHGPSKVARVNVSQSVLHLHTAYGNIGAFVQRTLLHSCIVGNLRSSPYNASSSAPAAT